MATLVLYLPSVDVDASVKWYTTALGFKLNENSYYPGAYAHIYLDGLSAEESRAQVMIRKFPDGKSDESGKPVAWHFMFDLTDREKGKEVVDAKYKEVQGKGVESAFADGVEDKPWGCRQFDLRDPDGHLISFFAYLK